MLAHDFKKNEKKVNYPCFIQPKLDGYRMIYDTTSKTITTRQGKDLPIIKESGELFKELSLLKPGLVLDGELYVHGDKFEALGVLRKTKDLKKEELSNLKKISYYVYDIIDESLTFKERNNILNDVEVSDNKIKLVETFVANNKEDIIKYHKYFIENGYEGTMVRNPEGKYKEKYRSYDLLKYKDFMDAEFKIIGFTYEDDHLHPQDKLIVWIVDVDRKMCNVRPKGTKEERQYLLRNADDFVGKKLWVKFFDYTADGNLRFPTTNRDTYKDYIRDEIE
jgi:ATP-dependent DNA ligase